MASKPNDLESKFRNVIDCGFVAVLKGAAEGSSVFNIELDSIQYSGNTSSKQRGVEEFVLWHKETVDSAFTADATLGSTKLFIYPKEDGIIQNNPIHTHTLSRDNWLLTIEGKQLKERVHNTEIAGQQYPAHLKASLESLKMLINTVYGLFGDDVEGAKKAISRIDISEYAPSYPMWAKHEVELKNATPPSVTATALATYEKAVKVLENSVKLATDNAERIAERAAKKDERHDTYIVERAKNQENRADSIAEKIGKSTVAQTVEAAGPLLQGVAAILETDVGKKFADYAMDQKKIEQKDEAK